jgi:hypothetical protein
LLLSYLVSYVSDDYELREMPEEDKAEGNFKSNRPFAIPNISLLMSLFLQVVLIIKTDKR